MEPQSVHGEIWRVWSNRNFYYVQHGGKLVKLTAETLTHCHWDAVHKTHTHTITAIQQNTSRCFSPLSILTSSRLYSITLALHPSLPPSLLLLSPSSISLHHSAVLGRSTLSSYSELAAGRRGKKKKKKENTTHTGSQTSRYLNLRLKEAEMWAEWCVFSPSRLRFSSSSSLSLSVFVSLLTAATRFLSLCFLPFLLLLLRLSPSSSSGLLLSQTCCRWVSASSSPFSLSLFLFLSQPLPYTSLSISDAFSLSLSGLSISNGGMLQEYWGVLFCPSLSISCYL